MPDRIYLPLDGIHYRRRDRLWAHWFAFCATLGSSGLGLFIVLAGVIRGLLNPMRLDPDGDGRPGPPWAVPGWEKWLNPAPSLAAVSEWQGVVVGLSLLLGGLFWVVASLTSFKYVEDYWKTLRAGLLLLILGWAAYVMCAADQRPEWVVPWWLGLTHCIAYLGGFYLTMIHQWRLKGFPSWVVKLSNRTAPFYNLLCKIADAPFALIEKRLGSGPASCDRMDGAPSPDNIRGGAGD